MQCVRNVKGSVCVPRSLDAHLSYQGEYSPSLFPLVICGAPCGGCAARQVHDAHDCLAITTSGRLNCLRLRAACALACFHDRRRSVWPSCWQAGFLSYPRTETDQFDPGYDLRVGHEPKRCFLRCCACDPLCCCSLHAVGRLLGPGFLSRHGLVALTTSGAWCYLARRYFAAVQHRHQHPE